MVSCEEQGSELPEPCSLGLASSWSVGLPNSREERRSPCEVRTPGWGGRSGQHRSRKLVDFECFPSGATTSISDVCNPCQPEHPGVPAYSALRPPVGGPVPQSSQGSRCLRGDQEEAGEQVEHHKDRESFRCWGSTKSKEESKSQSKGRQRRVRGGGRVSDDGNEKGEAKAGPPPSADVSRPTIQLPGSRAPTFHGRSLLKCCWRFMLRGRCRLSSFARSFVSRRFDHSKPCGTAARNVFPMPLPYPEVLRGGSLEDSLRGSMKRWICGVVVCLNYLFLGRPRTAGFEDWVGRPLTRKQWMVVERFEHLAAAWFHVSPVGPEAMGNGRKDGIDE